MQSYETQIQLDKIMLIKYENLKKSKTRKSKQCYDRKHLFLQEKLNIQEMSHLKPVDIFLLTETKVDDTFTTSSFLIDVFSSVRSKPRR